MHRNFGGNVGGDLKITLPFQAMELKGCVRGDCLHGTSSLFLDDTLFLVRMRREATALTRDKVID